MWPLKSIKNSAKTPLQSMKVVEFTIGGMHCVSCAMTIDGELEELSGVSSASTQYAKSCCCVKFDDSKITEEKLAKVISELGYTATLK